MVGVLSALVASTPPAAVSNLVLKPAAVSVQAPDANGPVEKEFQQLLADDDAAQAEADKWIRDNNDFTTQGAGTPKAELNQRILARFAAVRKSYDDFLQRHPDHARARLAYASFLEDIHDEEGAAAQMGKSLELDPKNPAVWNNLANYYGEHGPVEKAFDYYAKAIELNPNESVYYHNYGTTVYLFRQDAMAHFKITEQQVFDKALDLYASAMKLAPDDFPLATEIAQTYYAIQPLRTNAALKMWTNALQIAHDETEREGVQLHFARVKLMAGRLDEARDHLSAVTNGMYAELKRRLTKVLADKENAAKPANAPPVSTNPPAPPADPSTPAR